MTITHRRAAFCAFLTIVLAAMLLATTLMKQTTPAANAAFRCPTPVVTWPMVTRDPLAADAFISSSSWIDLKHRTSWDGEVIGHFYVTNTVEYRWCMDGKNPKFTGHVQPYRTTTCVMFRDVRPTSVSSVKWDMQGVYWPSLTSGKRQLYAIAERTLKVNTAASMKGKWQCQRAALSSPWASLQTHPQYKMWGHAVRSYAKDWQFKGRDHASRTDHPFEPQHDKHQILS